VFKEIKELINNMGQNNNKLNNSNNGNNKMIEFPINNNRIKIISHKDNIRKSIKNRKFKVILLQENNLLC